LPTAAAELAGRLAEAHGLGRVATLGWPDWSLASVYPGLRQIRLGDGFVSASSQAADVQWERSMLVADLRAAGDDVPGLLEALSRAPVAVLQAAPTALPRLVEAVQNAGFPSTFVGEADLGADGQVGLLVIDRLLAPENAAPSEFRVLAVVTAFNESDILESTVAALRADGVEVHLIDNWSTDGTFEIASRLAAEGRITLERFPAEAPTTFNHAELLGRVEAIANATDADWVIHHDMDERRRPPWSGMSLRDGLHLAQGSGFNAIDHTVVTFRPIDDTWRPGIDPEAHLRFFELESRPDLLLQVKAWRAGQRANLAGSGGHEVVFEGRRVFPYRFLLKHYPLRSQEQAERKIYRERRARWNPTERSRGWHHHYDDVKEGQSFIWRAEGLSEFVEGETQHEFLIPFAGGADIGQPWAAKARLTAAEDDYMRQQTLGIQRRLEAVVGPTAAIAAVGALRRVAWLVRPFRRAVARRRWRRAGRDGTAQQLP
jgi:hypothetical protein